MFFDKTQYFREKSAFFCRFDSKMCYNSVTAEPTSIWTRFSWFPWNSAYSSSFHLKNYKIVENRRTIVQRISRFWPSHGFLLKYNCPYRNFMEIPKMWIILINNQHLMEKSAFLCLFDNKMCYNSVTTEPTSKWTLFSCFPWNSAYSSCFRLKNSKIVENRRTIVQRISRFCPSHGFLLKYNYPYRNLMGIMKIWMILFKI